MGFRVVALICLLLAGIPPALAADAVEYGPAPAWLEPVKPPEDDAGKRADAPLRMIKRNAQLRFDRGGVETYVENYIRVQTPQGLQALGNITLPWKPDTDVLTVHHCELIRGDKVIDLIAAGQRLEVVRRENNLEYAALDGILTAVLQPNGMEVGDVLRLAFSVKRSSSLLPATEALISDVAAGAVERYELHAQWDRDTPMRWQASEDVKGARETRAGKQFHFRWTADDIEPLAQPMNVPARFWRFPHVEFTSYSSWNEVSRVLAPLYAEASALTGESPLKAEARAIAESTTDVEARLEAALKLTQERVRYVFLGMGDGNYKPAPADLTWQRRFGDCKGKTALLVALLRELGIAAEPVAVATSGGDSLSTRLPMVGAFDHVIVRAQAGGRTWWLDGTGSGSWRRDDMRTPNYSWGLPLTARGDSLVRMIAEPATQPFLETSTTIDAREGLHTDAPFTVETRMRGPVGAALHAELSQITQAQRDQGLRTYWKKEYDFVDITKVATEFDADHGVLILRMEGTARMDWGGYDYMTDGLRVGAYIDYSREPGINADAPFVMDHPVYQVTRQTILLPLVGKFTTKGADYDVTLAGTHYTRRSTIEDRIFRGEAQAKSLVPEITAREARDAEKRLQAMWRDGLEVHAEGYEPTKADIAALRKRTFSDSANLIWRGNIFLDQNDYEAAFADFDAAVKADAKSASALAHRGLANYWRNQPAPARADFEAALGIDAKQVVALRGYGALLHSLGDHEGAVDKLTASLRIDPDNTFALRHRAFSYSLLGKYTESLADAAHAIKLRPRMFEMYDLRAWIRAQQGDPEKALAEVAAMLAADPNDTNALWYASHTYARFERHAEAVEAMDRVIAKSPTAANYLKRSGVRGPDDNAGRLADIDAALKIDPGVPSGQMRRANALASAGDYRGSAAAFTAQIKASTSPSEQRYLRVLRAIVYVKLGDTASARKDLAAALSQGDGKTEISATFYNNTCWVLATAGVEAATALSACDKAVAMAPKNAAYLDSRGFVLMQLGRWQEAFAAYDESLKLRPGVASSLYGRGLARKRHCQCGDGDEDLAAALRIEPHTRRLFEKAGLTP